MYTKIKLWKQTPYTPSLYRKSFHSSRSCRYVGLPAVRIHQREGIAYLSLTAGLDTFQHPSTRFNDSKSFADDLQDLSFNINASYWIYWLIMNCHLSDHLLIYCCLNQCYSHKYLSLLFVKVLTPAFSLCSFHMATMRRSTSALKTASLASFARCRWISPQKSQ